MSVMDKPSKSVQEEESAAPAVGQAPREARGGKEEGTPAVWRLRCRRCGSTEFDLQLRLACKVCGYSVPVALR